MGSRHRHTILFVFDTMMELLNHSAVLSIKNIIICCSFNHSYSLLSGSFSMYAMYLSGAIFEINILLKHTSLVFAKQIDLFDEHT